MSSSREFRKAPEIGTFYLEHPYEEVKVRAPDYPITAKNICAICNILYGTDKCTMNKKKCYEDSLKGVGYWGKET